jgi:hypothetical protein
MKRRRKKSKILGLFGPITELDRHLFMKHRVIYKLPPSRPITAYQWFGYVPDRRGLIARLSLLSKEQTTQKFNWFEKKLRSSKKHIKRYTQKFKKRKISK